MWTTGNQSAVTEFYLLTLTEDPVLKAPLFFLFLLVYITTLLGNLGIITLIQTDRRLHTPMYFLLCNLSFVDFCYSSAITPRMLSNIFASKAMISLSSCAAQLFFFAGFAGTECCLLSAMSYDRYVAICHPLMYNVIMTKGTSIQLASISYGGGFLQSFIQTTFTFTLPFCGPNRINKIFCDVPPLLKLACADTFINEAAIFVSAVVIGIASLLTIATSYGYIISTVLSIPSKEGRSKAFSTCGAHFSCVILFYGTLLFMYLQPTTSNFQAQNKVISLIYTVVIPMLNPLIYSLRNQDVKEALRKIVKISIQ